MVSKHTAAAILLLLVSAHVVFMETKQINRVVRVFTDTNEFNQLSLSGSESRDTKIQHTSAQHYHQTIYQNEKRSSQHSNNKHDDETVISYEGASSFISILRNAHDNKRSLLRSSNSTVPNCNTAELRIRDLHLFHRAIDLDWVGRNLPAVMKSSDGSDSSSCNFVAAELRPTHTTLQHQLNRLVYDTVLHTAGQCVHAFQWEKDKVNELSI